jgi:hypothetical protein
MQMRSRTCWLRNVSKTTGLSDFLYCSARNAVSVAPAPQRCMRADDSPAPPMAYSEKGAVLLGSRKVVRAPQ